MGRKYISENYIDPVEFNRLLRKMKEDGDDDTWKKLCKYFALIAKRVLTKTNWVRYPLHQKDDMFQEAVLDMINGWKKYDPDRPDANVFAYFSQAAFNAYKQTIKDYKKRESIFRIENGIGLESLNEDYDHE